MLLCNRGDSMKKLICLVVTLSILSGCVYAAPYRQDYFKTSSFHINAINKIVHKYNLDIYNNIASNVESITTSVRPNGPSEPVEPVTPEVEEKKDYLTFADVVGGLCVVTSVTKTIRDEEKVTKLTYYVNNNNYENYCFLNNDSKSYAGKYDEEYIKPGSLVYLSVNTKGIAKKYSVVGYIDSETKLPVIDATAVSGTYNSNKIKTVSSYLVKDYRSGKNIALELGNGETIIATEDARLYTVDINRKKTEVISGDCLGAEVYEAIYDDVENNTEVYPVVAIIYDEEAAFVCSYTTPMYIEGSIDK